MTRPDSRGAASAWGGGGGLSTRKVAGWALPLCGRGLVRLAARAVLLTVLTGQLPALDPARQVSQYGFRTWGPDDGLPTGAVRALAQAADGWIWVGTDDGLCRFDGVRFYPFSVDDNARNPVRQVTALEPEPGGGVWVGTRGSGLLRWRQGKLVPMAGEAGKPGTTITALARDREGDLWAGTSDRGVYRLVGESMRRYTRRDGLPSDLVSGLWGDPAGGVWVGTADGALTRLGTGPAHPFVPEEPGPAACLRVALRDRKGGLWTGYSVSSVDETYGDLLHSVSVREPRGVSYEVSFFTPGDMQASTAPFPILEDRLGMIWFGTRKGVVRVNHGRMEILGAADGLPDEHVTSLLEDGEGNLWVGTRLGLTRLRDTMFIPFTRRQGLQSDRVLCVAEGTRSGAWVGTDNGLNKIENGRAVAYKAVDLAGTWVYDVVQGKDRTIWLATRRGLIRAHDQKLEPVVEPSGKKAPDVVHALCGDPMGTLWVGTATRGVLAFQNGVLREGPLTEAPPFRSVNDLAGGPDGAVWAATRGGLGRLRSGVVEAVPVPPEAQGKESDCLLVDADGTVWAGTRGAGLLRCRNGVARNVTTRQGLWHDTILSILDDGRGCLWMATPQGLFRARRAQLEAAAERPGAAVQCTRFGTEDGVRSLECLPGGCRTSDGCLWFCTIRGLCVVHPERAETVPVSPPPLIVEILADDQPVPPGQDVFAPGVRDLEFRFAALFFRAPEQLRFRSRLEGFDRDWSEPFTDRKVRFAALPPGEYTLRVQGRLPGGAWGPDGAVFRFTVQAPLIQRGWFQALILAVAVGLVLVGRRMVVRLHGMVREWRSTHHVGPYRLLETVGRGGMGTVWRAVHRKTGAEAAVKVLDTSPDTPVARDRFVREGLACERIDHPAVVKVFERGEDQGRLWYAMEFCRGRSLRALIGPEGIPPGRALDIFRKLIEAVRAIREAGVTHRDLKPENVFVLDAEGGHADGDGSRIKVLDFGLARLSDHRTRTSQAIPAGTVAYLPPEYLGSAGREDAGMDLYALGVILYEMLTGAPPFAGDADDPAAMLYAILSETPVAPSEIDPAIPGALSDLALRLIARNPADRLKTPEEIAACLAIPPLP
ncbi:MAG: protein kinase [Acidobacteria bacterium]|nr:protein kinase [Acidobacteriota bacterium]